MPATVNRPLTLKTLLIAVAAAAALIGAAVIAVPSAGEGAFPCLQLGRCVAY